jgi:N-acetylmuramoyl-L-alanine amidase
LEKKARAEEEAMLGKFRSEGSLTYQVKRVVIDPGHGGFDPGAVGPTGLKEKDVTLDLAQRVNQRISETGQIKSFLTRTGDYYIPLSDRTVIANQYQADLFISIHINANENRRAHGCETYYCSETASSKEAARVAAFENAVKYDEPFKKRPGYIDIEEILFNFERRLYWEESDKFAGTFQDNFQQALPFKNRGVHSANFFVLRRAKMPSILLETGFISNHTEEAELKKASIRDEIAAAVVRGLLHGRA